jgi:zinc transport system permease protein
MTMPTMYMCTGNIAAMTELLSTFLPEFFVRALAAAGLLALLTGPLGCLLIWRRMAFFGDALAHAALLGVALSLLLELPVTVGILCIGALFALLLGLLTAKGELANDTLLGIISPSALALGLIALSLTPGLRVDLSGYLFGDILALSWTQVGLMALGAIFVLTVLASLWRSWLQLTLSPDLAFVAGQPMRRLELTLLLLLALVVALGVQLVGVLLLTALLIIPAATARALARSPGQMAVLASLCGIAASILGLFASLQWDIPAGPAMVASSSFLFILSRFLPR